MLTPTGRLLELLELLQRQPRTTGAEIAERLGIDRRTVRRYVTVLKQLDIPIEGERGVGGGYRLRPGYRLPPLMLGDDEAVAVVLGLAAANRLGLADDATAVDGALAKLHRVLPDALRRRVEALESTLSFTAPPRVGAPVSGQTLLLLADANRRRLRIRTGYVSHAGAKTRRELSAYGLVRHAGCWYLAAHDHLRDGLRTFRVDRMHGVVLTRTAADPPPPGFDAVEHVTRSLAQVPWPWQVEVLVEDSLDRVARRLPATLGELQATERGTIVRARVASLDWMARMLAGIDAPFTIVRPDELRSSVRALADRLSSAAG
ncbi:MAG TPA: YafY family protein [Gaiellaceae bacterium]